MVKWEHAKERVSVQSEPMATSKMLEGRGRDGWELVSVIADGYEREFYFKRPYEPPSWTPGQ
jgi:hypothetical protein